MQKVFRVLGASAVCAALFLVRFPALAQPSSTTGADPSQQAAQQNAQAVSQTGVFPEFAVKLNFAVSQVDGSDVPSKSPNSGVADTLQRAWDVLKPAGFNTILFNVDLKDPQAAARVANLCIWAKANNVSLIPVLSNALTLTGDAAASFPGALISLLRAGDGQQFAAYTQIAYFQIEDPINVPLAAAGMSLGDTQKKLVDTVDALRDAESKALQGTGVQATPIMVSASFDYELIQQGAIAAGQLDSAAEQKAQAAFNKALLPLSNAANVDVISVAWFPRSITAGDEGHFVGLLRELEGAIAGKKLLLDTGFSTAFNPVDQQSQFLTLALTNLAGFRATEGADSRFVGVTLSQAFDNSAGKPQAAPPGNSDPSQWNWSEKAKQLAQMWSLGKKSPELAWWLEKVRAGRALLIAQGNASGGSDTVASQGLQAVQQFSTTVAQVSQNMTPSTISSAGQTAPSSGQAPSSSDTTASSAAMPSQAFNPSSAAVPSSGVPAVPTATAAAGPSTPSVFSQMLQTLVQQVTTQLTTAMVTKLTNKLTNSSTTQPQYPAYPAQNGGQAFGQSNNATTNYNANPQYPASPGASTIQPGAAVISLGPQDVTLDVANPAAGQTVHITAQLHNGSADQDISGLTVQLVDASNPAAAPTSQSGVAAPRSSVVPVQLTWTVVQPSGAPPALQVQVLDANGAQVASAAVPPITIANASAGTNLSSVSPAASGYNVASQTSATQTGQSLPSGNASATANGMPTVSDQASQTGAQGVTAAGASQAGQGPASSNTQSGTQTPGTQPQIVYFGPAATTAQNQSLSLEVTNPAATLISSAQAQLFVDGKPGPTQTLGPLLPSQTRSATFDSSTVGAGNHNIKVVVTTGDGATATAAASPAASPGTSRGTGVNKLRAASVREALTVRSGIPAGYQIGTVRTAAAPLPSSALGFPQQVPAAIVSTRTAAPPATSATSQSPVAANPSGVNSANASANQANSPTGATTALTPGSNQPGSGPAAAVPIRGPRQPGQVRTIVPQGASGGNQAGPAATVVPPVSASQPTAVRTVLPPGSTNQPATTATNAPTGVRTVLPQGSQTPNQGSVPPALPAGSTSPGLSTRTVVPPAPSSPRTTTVATTVLPPGRGLPGQPVGATGTAVPGRAYLDLSVTAAEIRFIPAGPGQPTTFTAVIHNLGTLAAQGASVVFVLNADGRITSSRPSVINVPPGGSFQASWASPIPPGQIVQLAVQVTANGDINPANNQAAIRLH